jgi:hypothetical protein
MFLRRNIFRKISIRRTFVSIFIFKIHDAGIGKLNSFHLGQANSDEISVWFEAEAQFVKKK